MTTTASSSHYPDLPPRWRPGAEPPPDTIWLQWYRRGWDGPAWRDDQIHDDDVAYVRLAAAALTTALAQLLEIDRHELVAAIGAVQCRVMARQVDAELAGR